jgi:hypothetical protein
VCHTSSIAWKVLKLYSSRNHPLPSIASIKAARLKSNRVDRGVLFKVSSRLAESPAIADKIPVYEDDGRPVHGGADAAGRSVLSVHMVRP